MSDDRIARLCAAIPADYAARALLAAIGHTQELASLAAVLVAAVAVDDVTAAVGLPIGRRTVML